MKVYGANCGTSKSLYDISWFMDVSSHVCIYLNTEMVGWILFLYIDIPDCAIFYSSFGAVLKEYGSFFIGKDIVFGYASSFK